jgi:thioredoxin 1
MKLVYLQAGWCGVCREKAPLVEELAASMQLRLEQLDHDDDGDRAAAAALRLTQVPTLALVDGARVRFRLVGVAITAETVAHLTRLTAPPG